jgi:hypothetical protein
MPLDDWIAKYPRVQALLQQPGEVLNYTVDVAETERVESLYAQLRVLFPPDRSGPTTGEWLRALLEAEATGNSATGPCQAAEGTDEQHGPCCGRPGILDPWKHIYACPRHLLPVFAYKAQRTSQDLGPHEEPVDDARDDDGTDA